MQQGHFLLDEDLLADSCVHNQGHMFKIQGRFSWLKSPLDIVETMVAKIRPPSKWQIEKTERLRKVDI